MSGVEGVRERRRFARRTWLRAYHGLRERRLGRQVEVLPSAAAPDGYPLPPPLLIVQTTGLARSQSWYLESGARDLERIATFLDAAGTRLEELRSVLDFGCGCGRIARRWSGVGPELVGCDINPR